MSFLPKLFTTCIFMELSALYHGQNYLGTPPGTQYASGKLQPRSSYVSLERKGDRNQQSGIRRARLSDPALDPVAMDDELDEMSDRSDHGDYLTKMAQAFELVKGEFNENVRASNRGGAAPNEPSPKMNGDHLINTAFTVTPPDSLVIKGKPKGNETMVAVKYGTLVRALRDPMAMAALMKDMEALPKGRASGDGTTSSTLGTNDIVSTTKLGQLTIPLNILKEESKLTNDSRELDELVDQVRTHRYGNKDVRVRKEKISKEMRSDLADLFMDVGEYLRHNFSIEPFWINALQKGPTKLGPNKTDSSDTSRMNKPSHRHANILTREHGNLRANSIINDLFDIDEHVGSHRSFHIINDLIAKPAELKDATDAPSPIVTPYKIRTTRIDFGNGFRPPFLGATINSNTNNTNLTSWSDFTRPTTTNSTTNLMTRLGNRGENNRSDNKKYSRAKFLDIIKQSQSGESPDATKNEGHNLSLSICFQLPIPPMEVLKWNNMSSDQSVGTKADGSEGVPSLTRGDMKRILYYLDAASKGGEIEDEETDSEAGSVASGNKLGISPKKVLPKGKDRGQKKANSTFHLNLPTPPDYNNLLGDVTSTPRKATINTPKMLATQILPQDMRTIWVRKKRFVEPEMCIKYSTITMYKECLGNSLATKIMLAKMMGTTDDNWITKEDLTRIIMCYGQIGLG